MPRVHEIALWVGSDRLSDLRQVPAHGIKLVHIHPRLVSDQAPAMPSLHLWMIPFPKLVFHSPIEVFQLRGTSPPNVMRAAGMPMTSRKSTTRTGQEATLATSPRVGQPRKGPT